MIQHDSAFLGGDDREVVEEDDGGAVDLGAVEVPGDAFDHEGVRDIGAGGRSVEGDVLADGDDEGDVVQEKALGGIGGAGLAGECEDEAPAADLGVGGADLGGDVFALFI